MQTSRHCTPVERDRNRVHCRFEIEDCRFKEVLFFQSAIFNLKSEISRRVLSVLKDARGGSPRSQVLAEPRQGWVVRLVNRPIVEEGTDQGGERTPPLAEHLLPGRSVRAPVDALRPRQRSGRQPDDEIDYPLAESLPVLALGDEQMQALA